MEIKKLDFNAPLPSVRRLGSPIPSNAIIPGGEIKMRSPLPAYTSDSVSGPIHKPGVVPFLWEKRPGQPKDSFRQGRTPDSTADLEKEMSRRSFSDVESEVSLYTVLPKTNNDDEDDDDDGESGLKWLRICGIFPRLCSKAKPKTCAQSSESGKDSESFESNPLSFWSSSSNFASPRRSPLLVLTSKNCKLPATYGTYSMQDNHKITMHSKEDKCGPELENLHLPICLSPSESWLSKVLPNAPVARPTLRSLFREERAMNGLLKLEKGQMRLAEVLAWPASED